MPPRDSAIHRLLHVAAECVYSHGISAQGRSAMHSCGQGHTLKHSHTHIHTHTHTYIHTRIHTHTHTHTHMHAHIHTPTHTHLHIHTHTPCAERDALIVHEASQKIHITQITLNEGAGRALKSISDFRLLCLSGTIKASLSYYSMSFSANESHNSRLMCGKRPAKKRHLISLFLYISLEF